MDIAEIQKRLREFAVAREWQRDHTPKNLVMALVCEVAELAEPFIWYTVGVPSPGMIAAATEEIADVLIYTLRLCDVLGIDPDMAVRHKIMINEERYPIAL